jgi:hypothetical protein
VSVTDSDTAELAQLLDRGREAWIHGEPQWEDPASPIAQADDATIFGPFGGVAPTGRAPTVRPSFSGKSRPDSVAGPVQRKLSARLSKATSLLWSTSTAALCDSAKTMRDRGCFGSPRCSEGS